MSGGIHPLSLLISLFGLVVIGVGILAFLAPVPADGMTPAQESLLVIGDGLVKVCLGGILGLGVSWLVSAGARGRAADLGEAG